MKSIQGNRSTHHTRTNSTTSGNRPSLKLGGPSRRGTTIVQERGREKSMSTNALCKESIRLKRIITLRCKEFISQFPVFFHKNHIYMIYILSSIIDLRFTHSIKSETRRNESKFLAYFWHNFGIILALLLSFHHKFHQS